MVNIMNYPPNVRLRTNNTLPLGVPQYGTYPQVNKIRISRKFWWITNCFINLKHLKVLLCYPPIRTIFFAPLFKIWQFKGLPRGLYKTFIMCANIVMCYWWIYYLDLQAPQLSTIVTNQFVKALHSSHEGWLTAE